jgi:DNA (cytosine-5)-methyltransferase 1
MNGPRFIDLFSGAGGLSYGLEAAGFRSVLAVDHWGDALKTFAHNNPSVKTIHEDLLQVQAESLLDQSGPVELVVGGPPCQGFSISGKRDPNDPRNILYQSFVDVVRVAQPQFFIMENVPNMASMGSGSILRASIAEFESLGYEVSHAILKASDFGVPQNRRRLFLVGSRDRANFAFPEPTTPTSPVTTAEGISDLPEDSLLDGTHNSTAPESTYQELMRAETSKVWNHTITQHTEQTKSIISLVPDGGNYKDLPHELRDTRRVNIAWTRFSSTRPSFTIDTGHRHHFHYRWDRIPTVRESARLQSFPDHFEFLGSKTSQYKQVGNAVPPLLAEAIGRSLFPHVR